MLVAELLRLVQIGAAEVAHELCGCRFHIGIPESEMVQACKLRARRGVEAEEVPAPVNPPAIPVPRRHYLPPSFLSSCAVDIVQKRSVGAAIEHDTAVAPPSPPVSLCQLLFRHVLLRLPADNIVAHLRDDNDGAVPVLLIQRLAQIGGGNGEQYGPHLDQRRGFVGVAIIAI